MAARQIVNGGFQDLSGAPLASGVLTFRLAQDIVNSSVQVAAGILVSVPLGANGNVSGTVNLWPGTYTVRAFTAAGQLVWQSLITIPEGVGSYSLTP